MKPRGWWKFWTWFQTGPELQVRAFRSDGGSKSIAERRKEEQRD